MVSVQPRSRDKIIIILALGILSLAAWLFTINQMPSMVMGGINMASMPAMSMGSSDMPTSQGTQPVIALLPFLLFLTTWIVMMTAMMLPSATPMVMTFTAVSQQAASRQSAYGRTALFTLGYLLAWGSTGLLAYIVSVLLPVIGAAIPGWESHAERIGASVFVVAGAYQLSPYKDFCLTKCRMPLGFIMTHWREGRGGALRMGLQHGLYCIGCCWALTVILFVVGLMNLAGMGLLALVMFGEKVTPYGQAIAKVSGALLLCCGAVLLTHSFLY